MCNAPCLDGTSETSVGVVLRLLRCVACGLAFATALESTCQQQESAKVAYAARLILACVVVLRASRGPVLQLVGCVHFYLSEPSTRIVDECGLYTKAWNSAPWSEARPDIGESKRLVLNVLRRVEIASHDPRAERRGRHAAMTNARSFQGKANNQE